MQPWKKSALSFSVHFRLQDMSQQKIKTQASQQYFISRNKKQYYINWRNAWLENCNARPMDGTQIIGIAAGVCTATSLLPQVIKTWKEKKAEDVSLIMLLILGSGIILWIVYGFKRDDLPIIVTNCFSLLVNITMVILRLRFQRSKK